MIKFQNKTWYPIIIWIVLFLFLLNISYHLMGLKEALYTATFESLTMVVTFYLTTLFLFPKYYNRQKYYIPISMVYVVLFALICGLIHYALFHGLIKIEKQSPPLFFIFLRYFLNLGFVYFVGTSISFLKQTQQLKAAEKLLAEEKLATELKLLKAQINPHFIFNALNNIYSLTYMKSKNAPESVLKLSEMLRYVFYDCNKDRVPLSSELNYIRNFTSFQQMKSDFKQGIAITTDFENNSTEIAPMIFIPFIENAYKYSRIEEDEKAYVRLSIFSNENVIKFQLENSVPILNTPGSGSGMGIKNVKHRLNIIYPEKHQLDIKHSENKYLVGLQLNIK